MALFCCRDLGGLCVRQHVCGRHGGEADRTDVTDVTIGDICNRHTQLCHALGIPTSILVLGLGLQWDCGGTALGLFHCFSGG